MAEYGIRLVPSDWELRNREVVLTEKLWRLMKKAGGSDAEYFAPADAREFADRVEKAMCKPKAQQLATPKGSASVWRQQPGVDTAKHKLGEDEAVMVNRALALFRAGALTVKACNLAFCSPRERMRSVCDF